MRSYAHVRGVSGLRRRALRRRPVLADAALPRSAGLRARPLRRITSDAADSARASAHFPASVLHPRELCGSFDL